MPHFTTSDIIDAFWIYLIVHTIVYLLFRFLGFLKGFLVQNHWQHALWEHAQAQVKGNGHQNHPLECQEGMCLSVKIAKP